MKSTKTFTLYHGSPTKLEVGTFIDPEFFGKYEDVKVPNIKTGKKEPAVFLTSNFDMAIRYARREVYSAVDCKDDIQYCIFKNTEQQFYIYKTELPLSVLFDTKNGKPLSSSNHGEIACFDKVPVIDRYKIGIQDLLDYYSKKNNIRMVARYLKNEKKIPESFGDINGLFGKPTFDSWGLKQDLNKYTVPRNVLAPGEKKKLFDGISDADKDYLNNNLFKGEQIIPNLTRNIYFDAVKYAISGFDNLVLNGSSIAAYNKYTTGWVGNADDNFGTINNPDSPKEFKEWYEKHAYNGGHPFEIYPYYCLYVNDNDDGEFYLRLADMWCGGYQPSIINKLLKMYLGLNKNGFSCIIPNYNNYVLDILNEKSR